MAVVPGDAFLCDTIMDRVTVGLCTPRGKTAHTTRRSICYRMYSAIGPLDRSTMEIIILHLRIRLGVSIALPDLQRWEINAALLLRCPALDA